MSPDHYNPNDAFTKQTHKSVFEEEPTQPEPAAKPMNYLAAVLVAAVVLISVGFFGGRMSSPAATPPPRQPIYLVCYKIPTSMGAVEGNVLYMRQLANDQDLAQMRLALLGTMTNATGNVLITFLYKVQ